MKFHAAILTPDRRVSANERRETEKITRANAVNRKMMAGFKNLLRENSARSRRASTGRLVSRAVIRLRGTERAAAWPQHFTSFPSSAWERPCRSSASNA